MQSIERKSWKVIKAHEQSLVKSAKYGSGLYSGGAIYFHLSELFSLVFLF